MLLKFYFYHLLLLIIADNSRIQLCHCHLSNLARLIHTFSDFPYEVCMKDYPQCLHCYIVAQHFSILTWVKPEMQWITWNICVNQNASNHLLGIKNIILQHLSTVSTISFQRKIRKTQSNFFLWQGNPVTTRPQTWGYRATLGDSLVTQERLCGYFGERSTS